jgi:hypothetical protein
MKYSHQIRRRTRAIDHIDLIDGEPTTHADKVALWAYRAKGCRVIYRGPRVHRGRNHNGARFTTCLKKDAWGCAIY